MDDQQKSALNQQNTQDTEETVNPSETTDQPSNEQNDVSEPTTDQKETIQEEQKEEIREPETKTVDSETEAVMDKSADEPTSTNQDTSDLSKKDNPNAKWYVVHTYSGHENKVAVTLKQRIESEHLQEKILEVLVPMQDKIEIKSGKKVNIKEKIFPGYILVKMVLDDSSWLAVRTTQGVTSFVGMGNKPTPISDAEVATIVKFTQSEAPMYKQVFTVNDTVKIVDGPFADFIGKIDSVDEEKGKVRVLVSIFGRETPVELDFLQIKKI